VTEDRYEQTKQDLFDSILSRSYDWYDESEEPEQELQFFGEGELPIFDEVDKMILMHRDVHFSGSFSAMLEYYVDPEAKGVHEDIERERILFLDEVEKKLEKNLAPLLISGVEAEKVSAAKKMYQELSEVASADSVEGKLAESILSEDTQEILEGYLLPVVADRPELLLQLACSDVLSDALFPGYGAAPLLAIGLLRQITYEPAIKPLFLRIGVGDFAMDSAILSALRQIGAAAREFAMQQLCAKPCTADNERAALVLLEFLPDKEIEALFVRCQNDQQMQTGAFQEYIRLGFE